MYAHCLDFLAQNILPMRGYYSLFQTNSSMAAAIQKWFIRAVHRVSNVIFSGSLLSEAGPVSSDLWAHQGPHLKTTSGLLPSWWKTLRWGWTNLKQLKFIEKSQRTHQKPLQSTTTCYKLQRWQTVENDWSNVTWPSRVISNHVNAAIETL